MEEGAYYHVFNRGNNRERIFKEEMNYHYFLEKYLLFVHPHAETLAYCLMPNHFHFLIRVRGVLSVREKTEESVNVTASRTCQDEKTSEVLKTSEVSTSSKKTLLKPIEKGFKDFFICYAKSINKKYGRTGSLFQSKFRKKEVSNEFYLKKAIMYIHNNPVAASLCASPFDWQHSSFAALCGTRETFLERQEVIEYFGDVQNFMHCHSIITDEELEESLFI